MYGYGKKKIIMVVMMIAVLFMAVGYALLSTSLNISGISDLTGNWNVKITDVDYEVTGKAYNISEPTYTDTTVRFNVGVKVPGDKMTFTVTVQNFGNIDALLTSIDASASGTETIIYGINGINNQELLKKGESKTFTVTTYFDINVTELPTLTTKDLTVKLNYVQYDEQTIESIPPEITDTTTQYGIMYVSNGGKGSMKGTICTVGQPCTLANNTFVKNGFGFKGWSTTPTGEVEYTNGESVTDLTTKGKTQVLYALWTESPKIESISFDLFKEENGNYVNYYEGDKNTSYTGKDTFYIKFPGDAIIDIYSLKVQFSEPIELMKTKPKTNLSISYIYSPVGGISTGKLQLPIEMEGIDTNMSVQSTDGLIWNSTSTNSLSKQPVPNLLKFLSNTLGTVEGIGKSKDQYQLLTPEYISDKVVFGNNTFYFVYPTYKTDKVKVTFVNTAKNNAVIESFYVPLGSQVPNPDEVPQIGYIFKRWCADATCSKGEDFDFSTILERDITIYGQYDKTEMDDRWYINYKDNPNTPEVEPYELCHPIELKSLAALSSDTNNFEGKTISLVCDVDLSGIDWSSYSFDFNGTFDGNYHTISNLSINETDDVNTGFFRLLSGATIKNIRFKNASVTAANSAQGVGVMAGKATNNSVISRVSVENSNLTTMQFGGAIVGFTTDSTIMQSEVIYSGTGSSSITTTGTTGSDVGSITAYATGSVILKDLYSNSAIKSGDIAPDAGGILGNYVNSNSNKFAMSNVIFTGTVKTGSSSYSQPSGEIYGRLGTGGKSGCILGFIACNFDDSYSSSFDKSTWLYDSTVLNMNHNKGTGKNTSWLKNPSNFNQTDWSYWSFTTNQYPRLKWVSNLYKVTFDLQGGTGLISNTRNVIYNESYGTLPIPSKEGYTFAGWYTALTGGTQVTSTTLVTTGGNHTLYARWI